MNFNVEVEESARQRFVVVAVREMHFLLRCEIICI
jgi:hypothetical protein